MTRQLGMTCWPVALRAVVAGCLLTLAWDALAGIALALRPLPAVAWLAASLSAFLLYPRLLGRRARRRRAATIGSRGPGDALPWLGVAIPFFLATALFLGIIQARLTSEPAPVLPKYRFASSPLGWTVLPLLVVAVVPVIEEVLMRGFVQGRIARRHGPLVGVCGAAAAFALLHGSRAWLLYFLSLGLLLGYARLATRSIWAAVTLHGAVNAAGVAMAPLAITPDWYAWVVERAHIAIPGSLLLATATMTLLTIHRAGVAARRRRRSARPGGRWVRPLWLTAEPGDHAGAAPHEDLISGAHFGPLAIRRHWR